MTVLLRARTRALLAALGFCLGSADLASAESPAQGATTSTSEINLVAQEELAAAQPTPDAPATTTPSVQGPATPRPQFNLPETVVTGTPYGVGAPGGATPGSTVVNSASLGGTPLGQAGSSVTVITAEQIQQRRQTSVLEMLRGLPGLNVVQSGGPGQPASVFIRGASSEQTKVILDGIWMNDPLTTGRLFDFSTLSVDNIDRIEVIRGPQSTLYGSDAIGGVINIVTKKGSGPRSSTATAMGGSFGMARESYSVSGGNQKMNYSAAGSYYQNTGISAADSRLPGNTDPNGFNNTNLSTRLGWTPTKNFDVEFIMRYMHGVSKTDLFGGPFGDDPNGHSDTDQLFTRTQLHYRGEEEIYETWLGYNTSNTTRDYRSDPGPNSTAFQLSHTNGTTNMVDWKNAVHLTKRNTLFAGASYISESGCSSFSFLDPAFPPAFVDVASPSTITDTAVYCQDQIQLGERWFTNVGVRQDNYSQAGLATTYRLSSLYRVPGSETAVRGSLGTGFKAPSIYQLFDAQFGRPNLLPEQSQGYDFGVDQPLFDNQVVLSATYFRNQFTNLIQFQSAGFSGFYTNVGRAASAGLEFTALVRLDSRTTLTGMYTKLDTRDEVNDVKLLRRPDDAASIGLNRKYFRDRANLNLTVMYVGQRDDIDYIGNRVQLDPYVVAYVAGSYNLTQRVQLFGRIDNLTDTRYQEVSGFGVMPFSGYAGASATW
ncbi:MAG: TonB-dependent receptor [Planctomycetes bacterium]|nr:TonB-dependent receptor [Planctomycetota bacterium]